MSRELSVQSVDVSIGVNGWVPALPDQVEEGSTTPTLGSRKYCMVIVVTIFGNEAILVVDLSGSMSRMV